MPSSEAGGRRSACTPSHTRYSAPAHFTTVNADDDHANNAPNPNAAPAALPKLPSATPPTDANPEARPWPSVRATM